MININDAHCYWTDDCAVLCGEHLGATAKMTGYDLSGLEITRVTSDDVREASAMGITLCCERCSKRASLLDVVECIDDTTARAAIEQSDFRRDAEVASTHNGQRIWIATCYELVDGRWEGFVTMRKRTI